MNVIRLGAAVLFIVLLAAYCTSKRGGDLERQAGATASARGLTVWNSRVVHGRGAAVCGVASGKRFIARDPKEHPARLAFIAEGDLPKAQFEALYRGWCD